MEAHSGGILENKLELGIILPSLTDHFGRSIQADDLRTAFRNLRGELSGAASEIENAFPGFRIKQLDQVFAEFENKRVTRLVQFGIPPRYPAHWFQLTGGALRDTAARK